MPSDLKFRRALSTLSLLAAACGSDGEPPSFSLAPFAPPAPICTPNGSFTGYDSGVDDGVSLATVRAAQCEGVTYDHPSDVDAADQARAVSVGPVGTTSALDAVTPTLYGVLRSTGCSPSEAANAYADEHSARVSEDSGTPAADLVGLPLIGVDVGTCTASCERARGERCQGDRCRAYPIVESGQLVVLSGANLWDLVTPWVRFSLPGVEWSEDYSAAVNIMPEEQDLVGRCAPTPIAQDADIAPGSPAPSFTEHHLDQLVVRASVQPGTFYGVQTIATNGSYFRAGDTVPLTAARKFHSGRVIHLCSPPQCDPPSDDTGADCSLEPLATCGDDVGGVWHEPPRSLEHCDSLIDFNYPDYSICPETPIVFISHAESPDGLPLLMYVTDPPPHE